MRITDPRHEDDVKLLLRHLRDTRNGGVIHVGAHRGEEVEAYLQAGFERVVLIEPQTRLYTELVARFAADDRVQVFQCAISDRDGLVDLHIHTSRAGSVEPASILPLKRFAEIVKSLHTPEIIKVPSLTLDSFYESHGLSPADFNLLNIDVQGAELLVLKGATHALRALGAVICEVSLLELYEGAAQEEEIVEFLAAFGLRRADVVYHTLYDELSTFPAWGECLFLRETADA